MRTALRFVLLFSTVATLHAQTQVQQPRFALEIGEDGYPPHFVMVPEGPQVGEMDAIFFSPSLHPLTGHDAGNSEKTQPSAVKLVCKVDGDAVAITATAIFGPIDETGTNLSLQGHPQQKIGRYSQHLNESVVLEQMEQFGLQPWTIKIVNAQLSTPLSLATLNEVPSIQPEILGKDREGYRMALHNLSSRAVTAFLVETSFNHNSNTAESVDRGVLIAPDANHEFRLFCDPSASVIPNSVAPGPAPCAFNLKAALFADGSYEGDASAAATLAVGLIAAQSQGTRVHELIDNIVADSSMDDSSRLARIRSELPKLSEEPDPTILEQIRLRFPGLPSTAWDSVEADLRSTLAVEKQRTLRALKEFEDLPNQGSTSTSLAQWWSAWERTDEDHAIRRSGMRTS
jgi:hypothetical protein